MANPDKIAYSEKLMDDIAASYKSGANEISQLFLDLDSFRKSCTGGAEYEGKAREAMDLALTKLNEHIKLIEAICLCAEEYVLNAKQEAQSLDTNIGNSYYGKTAV